MAVSFVAFASTATFTVQEATTLLVVAVTRNAAVGAGATATWDGIALSVANNANDWTQVFYLVDPPAGEGEVIVTGASVEFILSGQYEADGALSFGSAQEGDDNDSFSFSPTGSALMVYSIIAFTTSHTPLASNTERFDTDGSYYCDRIVGSGGTYSVGIASGDEPAGVGALFNEAAAGVEVSAATLTLPSLELTGSATVAVAVGNSTLTLPNIELSGSATVAVGVSAATLTLPSLELSGSATVAVAVSAATLTLPALELSGQAFTEETVEVSAATLTLPALTLSGTITLEAGVGEPVALVTVRSGAASASVSGGGALASGGGGGATAFVRQGSSVVQ